MTPILQSIADMPRDYANGSLELAVRILEAERAFLPIEELRPTVQAWIESIYLAPACYKRSPTNNEQSSHDELLGILILDALYKLGIAKQFLDHKGLWIFGVPHSRFDSEWLALRRPEYRAMIKLVDGMELNLWDRMWLHGNLRFSTTWNLLRARLQLLSYLGIGPLNGYYERLGDKFKGRYGDEPVINALWKL